jgi:hypothetical protein
MRYYDITNSAIVSERQILRANPNTSFALPLSDAALAGLNMAKLLEDPRPSYDAGTQTVIEGAVEERSGSYYQTYSVIDHPAEAIANDLANKKSQVRAQRNARLAETDWAILPDSPLSEEDKAVYQGYRNALRDVPAQDGFPNNALPEGPDQQPYESWSYDSTNFVWTAPLPKPEGEAYWSEDAYQEDNTKGWITYNL